MIHQRILANNKRRPGDGNVNEYLMLHNYDEMGLFRTLSISNVQNRPVSGRVSLIINDEFYYAMLPTET